MGGAARLAINRHTLAGVNANVARLSDAFKHRKKALNSHSPRRKRLGEPIAAVSRWHIVGCSYTLVHRRLFFYHLYA